MATTTSTSERVIALVAERVADKCVINAGTTFHALGFDSLDRTELALACEDAFSLRIPQVDIMQLLTVGELVTYIDRRLTAVKG